jgi:hypothetical protein
MDVKSCLNPSLRLQNKIFRFYSRHFVRKQPTAIYLHVPSEVRNKVVAEFLGTHGKTRGDDNTRKNDRA